MTAMPRILFGMLTCLLSLSCVNSAWANENTEAKMKNFRESVEAIVVKDGKMLLTKRADNCKVAPSVWNVPAGKAEKGENPDDAVVRECFEETGIKVSINHKAATRKTTIKVSEEDAERLYHTYILEPNDTDVTVILNNEHSEYVWVDQDELQDSAYDSLLPALKDILSQVELEPLS
ncbi:MAG: 8-oxo-dGTP diphosphatase [Chlamydiales bacterium]|jgi:8-oxo-dGTP diphosphatase